VWIEEEVQEVLWLEKEIKIKYNRTLQKYFNKQSVQSSLEKNKPNFYAKTN